MSEATTINAVPMANHAGGENRLPLRPGRLKASRYPACHQMPQWASSINPKTSDELLKLRRPSSTTTNPKSA